MEATGVNAAAPSAAVMMSIAAIAREEGVSKAAVSRKVKRLCAKHGLRVERSPNGNVVGVNVAHYKELRGEFDDPSKAQAPAKPNLPGAPVPEGQNESYDEALRVKTWVEAERAKLKLEAEQSVYVHVEQLGAALTATGEEIVRRIDQIAGHADDLSAAAARDGLQGLRAALKKIAAELKTEIADALAGCVAK